MRALRLGAFPRTDRSHGGAVGRRFGHCAAGPEESEGGVGDSSAYDVFDLYDMETLNAAQRDMSERVSSGVLRALMERIPS